MDSELSNLIKELLTIIDELRVIDSPEIINRLNLDDTDESLLYAEDFVDTYEAIRRRLVELGELPKPPYDVMLLGESEGQ
jgi:hypothetical protein